jgi:hypothetical protein
MDMLFAGKEHERGTNMKKTIVATIFLVVLLSGIWAQAESALESALEYSETNSFSIRNGIHFGMTKEEVIAKELFETESRSKYGENSLLIQGSIAGTNGAKGYYYFDEDNLLDSLLYDLDLIIPISTSSDIAEKNARSEYDRIEKILNDKYGDVLKSNCYVNSESFLWDINYAINHTSSDSGAIDWDQRLLKISDGGYVKIEHYMLYDYEKSERKFEHKVIYSLFTDTEIEAIVKTVYETSEDKGGSTEGDL